MTKFRKHGFTLAEVLITLAIIGVVAALTIPTLWAKVGQKVADNQNKVFQAKIIKALNLAKNSGDLHDKYTSTEDFLRNGLAKHYKMSAICGANNLRDCIPYDTIKYMDGDTEKTVNVADLKTAKSIQLDKEGFEDTAAFVTADGIPVIISYDKTCTVDTEKLDRSISSCVAGIYDLNGSKLPNKYGFTKDSEGKISSYTNDLRAFNGAGIGSSGGCKGQIGDVCIAQKAFNPIDIYEEFGSPTTAGSPDYFKAAKLYCESKGGQLPDKQQLAELVRVLYGISANEEIVIQDCILYEDCGSTYGGDSDNFNSNIQAFANELGISVPEGGLYLSSSIAGENSYLIEAIYESFHNSASSGFDDAYNAEQNTFVCVK